MSQTQEIPNLDTLEARQNLCRAMARDAHTFNWDTPFPEPGLSQAISDMHRESQSNTHHHNFSPGLVLLTELMQVSYLFHVYHVPESQVDARFDEMGLGYYWRATRKDISCADL